MRVPLIVTSVLLTALCFGQQRSDTLRGVFHSFYFPEKDILVLTHRDGITMGSPDQITRAPRKKIKGMTEKLALGTLHLNGDRLLIIHPEDRSIYRITADSIEQHEILPFQRMTIETTMIRKDGILYLFGGYGLWSNREILLRLNAGDHWEPVQIHPQINPNSKRQGPPGVYGAIGYVHGEDLIFFNGFTVDPSDPLVKPVFNEVWSFESGNRWDLRGQLNREIFTTTTATPVLATDDQVYFFPNPTTVAELDSNGVTLTLHHHSLYSFEVLHSDFQLLKPFYRKGKMYYYKTVGITKDRISEAFKVILLSIPIAEFANKPYKTAPLYFSSTTSSPTNRWLSGVFAATAVLAILIVLILKRKRPPLLELIPAGLRFKSEIHELPELHNMVLRHLLQSGNPVSSNDLMELVQNPNLKYAHNNRVKNDIIRQLNVQLKSILNIKEDLITSTVSEQDKRYRWYRIDRSRFATTPTVSQSQSPHHPSLDAQHK